MVETQAPATAEGPAEQPTAAQPTEAQATEPPAAPETTRHGGWADTLVYTSINEASDAIAQLKAGAIDIYSFGSEDTDAFNATQSDPNLAYSIAIGNSVDGYMFNPAGPEFTDGRLNPFSNPKVREAINWLIDRNYLAQEAIGPMGKPMTVVLVSSFPDYVRYVDIIRPLEAKYSYNLEKARDVISAEMEAMGASLSADGKWQYNGEPVEIAWASQGGCLGFVDVLLFHEGAICDTLALETHDDGDATANKSHRYIIQW